MCVCVFVGDERERERGREREGVDSVDQVTAGKSRLLC